jgi:NADH dehydrogenase (ubiquinone) Fe-S protein 2
MVLYKLNKLSKIQSFLLNFGPQHPAAHGVLRLIIELIGEQVLKVDPHIGLLHRGTEKLIEYKTYLQALPYVDRLDYVSMMAQEQAFSIAVERLFFKSFKFFKTFFNMSLIAVNSVEVVNSYFYYMSIFRVMMAEITRILNHLLAITTHALDVGAITPFLWAFEEREKLMECYEIFSGARMHGSNIRPGGFTYQVSLFLIIRIKQFLKRFPTKLFEIEDVLNNSVIWHQRLIHIGICNKNFLLDYNITGVLLRGSGINYDIRKKLPYDNYNLYNFNVPLGKKGDCYDRYILRIREMKESMSIISQCIYKLDISFSYNIFKNFDEFLVEIKRGRPGKLMTPYRTLMKFMMESMIHHFKLYTEGFRISEFFLYTCVESPKGEFGITFQADNSNIPYRCKFKTPGYFALQSLDKITKDHLLADLVTIIGTQDIVFGEIDR